MTKRILSIFTALALCLTMLPATALAVDIGTDIPNLGIGSTPQSGLKGDVYYLIDGSGKPIATDASEEEENYNVYYDSATETLTLKDAKLKDALFVPGGTTIQLVGENVFGSEDQTVSVGIQIESAATGDTALTVKGDGSLTIWCLNEGIVDKANSEKDILIEDGTIRITNTQSSPIYSGNGSITIRGNANVTANSGNSAISCAKNLTITGNAVVNATNTADALHSSKGKIKISENAQVTAKSTGASSCAIHGDYGLEILDKASVTAEGAHGGLSSFYGYILIEGKATATASTTATAYGGYAAVSAGTNYQGNTASVTVRGELTAKGFVGIGVDGAGDIIIDGGTVTADATLVGIYPQRGGNVVICNNAEVVAGATSAYGIHVNGGRISISNSTVESSTGTSVYYALGAVPTLTYDDSYKVYAGASKEVAALIPHADLNDATYQNNYVKIEPVSTYNITVNGGSASAEKAAEGEIVTITAAVSAGQQFVNWMSDQAAVEDADAVTTTFTMPAKDVTVTAVTTSTAQAAPSAAPEPDSHTATSITLKEIAANDNGAAAQYGISTDGGVTWIWQDSPVFTGLSAKTTYTFAVRYGATDNYAVSPNGPTAEITTSARSSGSSASTYKPTVEKTDNGTASVSPKNPQKGDTVTITTKPDTGYEVDEVIVTDKNGDEIRVKDKGDGVYTFTMPASKVEVKVTFVELDTACDGGKDCPSYHLADVDASKWYHPAVDFVTENGLMNGYGDGRFGPNDTLSRAELAQILYNREERPGVVGGAFTDVADGAWYADAVIWINRNGIMTGYGSDLFGPNDPITREQLAAILWRYAGSPMAAQKRLSYLDADQVSDWALNAMLWADENGVINGSGSFLNPQGSATRAEAAQMLMNFFART